MPDPPYPVPRLLEHLRLKWLGRPCQMCGQGNWNVSDKLFELREFHQGSLSIGGPLIAVIPIVCTNCGNTILINALAVAGLVQTPAGAPPGGGSTP